MTRAEIREEVRRRIRESVASPTFWTDEDIDVSVNEGYMEMSDASEWYERFQVIDVLARRPYYDMRTQLRRGFLVAGPAYNMTTSRWLFQVSSSDLGINDIQWELRVSEPEFFMVRGLWWIGYWPVKGAESGTIKQYFIGLPPPMTQDDEEPGFFDLFHHGLVEYALWDLFAQDAEADLAYAAWKEYLAVEAKLIAYQGKRAGIPHTHGNNVEGS